MNNKDITLKIKDKEDNFIDEKILENDKILEEEDLPEFEENLQKMEKQIQDFIKKNK